MLTNQDADPLQRLVREAMIRQIELTTALMIAPVRMFQAGLAWAGPPPVPTPMPQMAPSPPDIAVAPAPADPATPARRSTVTKLGERRSNQT
jgi:hypothetical protein